MISPSRFEQYGSNPPDDDVPPGVRTEHGIDPLAPLKKHLAELAEYVGCLLSVKSDSVRSSLRSLGMYATVGFLGTIAAVALIAKATTMMLGGIAGGLGELFGQRLWAGQLVTAFSVLVVLAIVIYVVMSKLTNSSRLKAVQKYEQRRHAERAKFGHDYRDRAAQPREADRS